MAGTHGNERNAPWLLEHWRRQPEALQRHGLDVALVLGNPAAHKVNQRYVERDLNRCFAPELLADSSRNEADLQRARQLLACHGPDTEAPSLVVLDLHSTTSAMGNSWCSMAGGRPISLWRRVCRGAGAADLLARGRCFPNGLLVERWPCGLVIEVGPVPQGLSRLRSAVKASSALRRPWPCWRQPSEAA